MTSLIRPVLQRHSVVFARRTFASGGTRGSRGHGWLQKYREGRGGRHLQGEYWDAPTEEEWKEWNDSIFDYGSQFASLTIEIDGKDQRTFELELATAVLPKTTRNFQLLLEDGSYNDTNIYRIEKGVGFCMGDTLGMDGKGGKCHESMALVQGGSAMETEPLVLAHIPGIVTMMSPGIDKVDSRFMLCTRRAQQLDGRHVAFGRLTSEESLKLVQDWEESIFTKRGRPTVEMKLVSSTSEVSETPATA